MSTTPTQLRAEIGESGVAFEHVAREWRCKVCTILCSHDDSFICMHFIIIMVLALVGVVCLFVVAVTMHISNEDEHHADNILFR